MSDVKFSNVAAFNAELKRWQKKVLPEEFEKGLRKVALDSLTGIVLNTRVKTGRARGNWQVTFNKPAKGQIERLSKNGVETINAGLAKLARLPNHGYGLKIFLTNNVPYITKLEELDHMVSETFQRQKLAFR